MKTNEIWKDFKNELLGFINSRVNDHVMAEDILQDVFIKIHLHKDDLKSSNKLTSWIYQITRNSIIDYYRKKKINYSIDEFDIVLPPEANHESSDFTNCLSSFINQLSEKDQDIILKTSLGGQSQKEYAHTNNLSYTATKSRVQRAKSKLKSLFISCCNVEFDVYGNIISEKKDDCNC